MSKKILIVEDNDWLAEQFEAILSTEFSTARVADGAAAMEIIEQDLPDALLLDMLLTGPGALGVLHELQSYADTSNLPVVVCTSLPDRQQLASSLAAYGVRAVLDKTTVTPQRLLRTFREVIV
ncbi:MAG TPA: response regulator [Candidatus Saccharimonadales bacterium]